MSRLSTSRLAAGFAMAGVLAACADSPTTSTSAASSALEPQEAPAFSAGASAEHIPGRFIVTLRDRSDARGVAREHGVAPDFVYSTVLNGFAGSISDAARAGLLRDARVERIEQDGIVTTQGTQTGATWGLDRTDQHARPTDGTYSYTSEGSGVTAYIIDTGILYSHSEFGGRATPGVDKVTVGGNAADCNGHGTHVAGTVGGSTYGIAKKVSLVAVRVLDCSGSGSWSGVIAGMDWAAADHVNKKNNAVANMSLGGGASSSVDNALKNLIASGVTVGVAAGNGNRGGRAQDACGYSPARVPEAITVGATDMNDTKTSWSNYGPCVDIFAPGLNITSAWYNGGTNTISGTSMATPHVVGVAARFLGSNPGATPAAVTSAVLGAVSDGIVKSANTANNDLLYWAPTQ
jgi:subtilisin family serine protease